MEMSVVNAMISSAMIRSYPVQIELRYLRIVNKLGSLPGSLGGAME